MLRRLLICIFFVLSVCIAEAQQVLLTATGKVVGTRLDVATQAPYCILFPDDVRSFSEMVTLGRKLNNLGANVLLVPSDKLYTEPVVTADQLVNDIGWRVAELRKLSHAPIFLFAENRVSAAALIAATKYFAIKGVIAASTGEYFPEKKYVERSLSTLRVPVLALSTPDESETVKGVFHNVPRRLVVFSSDLKAQGYTDLLQNTKQAGKIWLALSVFYHEHFEN